MADTLSLSQKQIKDGIIPQKAEYIIPFPIDYEIMRQYQKLVLLNAFPFYPQNITKHCSAHSPEFL